MDEEDLLKVFSAGNAFIIGGKSVL